MKLELYALFQQAKHGDAKEKDFSHVPEEHRQRAMQN